MRRIFPVILSGAALTVFIVLHILLLGEAKRLFPQAVLLENPYGLGISLAEYQKPLKAHAATTFVTGAGIISAPDAYIPVSMVYTDNRYGGITGLHMLNGVFLPDGGEQNAVVISERLATNMFYSTDIIGAELVIGRGTYLVCGVYKEETSLAARLSGNGLETVYLSLESYPETEPPIKSLWVPAEDNELIESVTGRLSSSFGKQLLINKQTDYRTARLMAEQSGHLLLFLLGIQYFLVLLVIFTKKSNVLYNELHTTVTGYEQLYDKRELLLKVTKCMLYANAAILILSFIVFDLYLPADWLDKGVGIKQLVERFIVTTQRLNISDYNFMDIYVRRMLIWMYSTDIFAFISNLFLLSTVHNKIRHYQHG